PKVAEWRLSRMAEPTARLAAAANDGRWLDDKGVDPGRRAPCAGCHSAQGHVWVRKNRSLHAFLAPDEKEVEPVTCVACHDPMGPGGKAQLRAWGDTTLPLELAGDVAPGEGRLALTVARGVGSGAVCLGCHSTSSRTGLATGPSL